jgi:hypothetical protein
MRFANSSPSPPAPPVIRYTSPDLQGGATPADIGTASRVDIRLTPCAWRIWRSSVLVAFASSVCSKAAALGAPSMPITWPFSFGFSIWTVLSSPFSPASTLRSSRSIPSMTTWMSTVLRGLLLRMACTHPNSFNA